MNEASSKPSTEKMLFARLRNLQNVRAHPTASIVQEKLTFDNVAACNIYLNDLDTISSAIILCEVPRFLTEAFSRFDQLDGCNVEGIFRKEGNAARMKGSLPVFFGLDDIPAFLQIHDICSWIKKFFRELQTPVFLNREGRLIKFAEDLQGPTTLLPHIIAVLDSLPAPHIGALGYLMRCLKEISDHADQHHMTIDNLATVFAPSLFRNLPEYDTKSSTFSKKKTSSQEDLLKDMKKNNDLQVLVIKLLIQNANLIGAPKDCYKSSRFSSQIPYENGLPIVASKSAFGNAFIARQSNDVGTNGTHKSKRRSYSVSRMVGLKPSNKPDENHPKVRRHSLVRSTISNTFGSIRDHLRTSITNLTNSEPEYRMKFPTVKKSSKSSPSHSSNTSSDALGPD